MTEHVLSVVAIRDAVLGHVGPQVSGTGLVHIRDALFDGKLIRDGSFEIVATLVPSIPDLPCALGVVAGDCRRRPNVAVAGNLAAVIKVVEHAKLSR